MFILLFSHQVMSDSLTPHRLQHTRLPCPSPSPRVYSNSCPLSQWCYPTISSSVALFSSSPQSFPASGSFPTSRLFVAGGQSIGASASASVSPSNECSGLISFRIDWLDLFAVLGTFKRFHQHHNWKASILSHSASIIIQLLSPYMTSGKTTALTIQTFVSKVISLLFNTLFILS